MISESFYIALVLLQLYVAQVYSKRFDGKLQCLTSKESVLEYQRFCDGKFDCLDLSDEFFCSREKMRYKNRLQRVFANLRFGTVFEMDSAVAFSKRMCIPYVENALRVYACDICDSGEFVCDPFHIAKKESVCVKASQVCDGVRNCPNAEDEQFCHKGLQNNDFRNVSAFASQRLSLYSLRRIEQGELSVSGILKVLPMMETVSKILSNTNISCFAINRFTKMLQRRFGTMIDNWLFASLQGDLLSLQKNFREILNPNSSSSRNFSKLFQSIIGNRSRNFAFLNREEAASKIKEAQLMQLFAPPASVTPEMYEQVSMQFVGVDQLCDGESDCEDSSDELFCPGKFYCKSKNPLYVDNIQVMDGVADCSDSSDEWTSQRSRYTLSSNNSLIESWVLQVLIWVIGIAALMGNATVIINTLYEFGRTFLLEHNFMNVFGWVKVSKVTSNEKVSSRRFSQPRCRLPRRSHLVRIWNSILVLNLAIADLLMGIYLSWLAGVSSIYEGRSQKQSRDLQYWNFDRTWRTSSSCNFLGVLLVVSSQTSVFTLVSLTSLRLYTVLKPFACYRLKFRYLVFICICTWLFSIILAVTPIFPTLENNFITAAFVPMAQVQPPDINRTSAEEIVRGVYYLSLKNNSGINELLSVEPLSWNTMLHSIQTISPHYSNWRFYGYYSEDSVCMPKLFVNPQEDKFWGYTISIISINCASVIYIAVAYVIICSRSAKKSRKTKNGIRGGSDSCHNHKQFRSRSSCAFSQSSLDSSDHSTNNFKNLYKYSRKKSSAEGDDPTKRRKNTNAMHKRVALLVLTDCLCWIPICITCFLSAVGHDIPQLAYAITAVILLPINSALNPLLYSKFLRFLWLKVWSTLRLKAVLSVYPSNTIKTNKSTAIN